MKAITGTIRSKEGIGPDALKFGSLKLGAGREAKAVFVPEGKAFGPEKVMEVIKKRWELEPPNLLIKLDVGTRHPSSLATEKLLDAMRLQGVPEVAQILQDLRDSL